MKITTLALSVSLLLLPVSLSAQNPALCCPLLVIDNPSNGASLGQDFSIRGTALNSDIVHIWAMIPSGNVFLGYALPSQADPVRQIQGGSFTLAVYGAPLGDYPIVVYAHAPGTNTFPVALGVNVHVHACQNVTVSWPFYGIYGWTVIPYQVCG